MIKYFIALLFICSQLIRPASAALSCGAPKPQYFTLEDLRSGLKQQYFSFANYSQPINARVDLGAIPTYPANYFGRELLGARIRLNPTQYRVNASHLYSYWNDLLTLDFNWGQFNSEGGLMGDLIFCRANFTGADVVKIFSNWTHVAIAFDIPREQVFEATPKNGVYINETGTSWGKVSYYTCKRITGIDRVALLQAVKDAINKHWGRRYFPSMLATGSLTDFVLKWCNKNDLSSMYCSKLIYWTFKDLVNFDTNSTCVENSAFWDPTPGAPSFSWIGISPDDIYYSYNLGLDFCFSPNLLPDLVKAEVKG